MVPESECTSGFLCTNSSQCIEWSQLCDNTTDCSDESDEGDMCCKFSFIKIVTPHKAPVHLWGRLNWGQAGCEINIPSFS